jgi:hypothetical protein
MVNSAWLFLALEGMILLCLQVGQQIVEREFPAHENPPPAVGKWPRPVERGAGIPFISPGHDKHAKGHAGERDGKMG